MADSGLQQTHGLTSGMLNQEMPASGVFMNVLPRKTSAWIVSCAG